MKKRLCVTGMLVIVCICYCLCSYVETHYTREAEVVSVDGTTIEVEDKRGFLWAFDGEGFEEGDSVKMKMFTNCTDSVISDDVIEDVKKLKNKLDK